MAMYNCAGRFLNMAEKRLGRGLDYLLSRTRVEEETVESSEATPVEEGVANAGDTQVPLGSIRPNPFQPRREFSAEAIEELAGSIREHGVLQPILLRPRKDGPGYDLVAGERRWRAAAVAGLAEIPATVRDVPDESLLAVALVENLQRENLNPVETALAYRQLLEVAGTTQEDVARVVGKSRAAVANTVRLLDLPEDLQSHVSRGTLSPGHARALLAVGDPDAMRVLATRIVDDGLSVRDAERIARGEAPAMSGSPGVPPPAGGKRRERSSHLMELEDRLRRSLGSRVAIKTGRGKRGKIVLYYASLEDFDRLFEILSGAEVAPSVAPPEETKFF